MMRIALDYDQTYTLDPRFWDAFILAANLYGHDVRIVTVRDERHDRTAPLIALEEKLPVIYTRGVAKGWFCTHFTNGWRPDIWIDDSPRSVLENSSFSPEQLIAWRAERGEPVA
jgi:hypothetical protein